MTSNLNARYTLEQISQRLASLPRNSSVNTVEQTVRDVATQLQRTEHGLANLRTSVNDQTTMLQRLGTSLQDDISTEGRKLLQTQASMLSATLTTIRENNHATLDNLINLDQRLDEADQRIPDSSSGLKAILNDQKIGIQACQMHLKYIEEAVQDIYRVSKQQAAEDWRSYGLEILKTAGAVIGAFAGISNMLTLRTLKTGLETPAEEKLPKQDIIPTPQTQRNLEESAREDSRIPASDTASRKGGSDLARKDPGILASDTASRKGGSELPREDPGIPARYTASRNDCPEFMMDSRNAPNKWQCHTSASEDPRTLARDTSSRRDGPEFTTGTCNAPKLWVCHLCYDGPCLYENTRCCIQCGHLMCGQCKMYGGG